MEASGRRRFNFIPTSFVNRMSKDTVESVLTEYRGKIVSSRDPRHQQVQRVLARLVQHSGLSDHKWSVHLIDDPGELNAFVLPGACSIRL